MTTLTHPSDLSEKGTLREEWGRLGEYVESVFDNAPVMMHLIDKDGRLSAVNHLWLKKMGYEKDEVLGLRSIDFLTEESRARALKDTFPAFQRLGYARSVGYQFVRKDDRIINVLLDAETVEVSHHLAAVATLRDTYDLSQWKQSSATLQAVRGLIDSKSQAEGNLTGVPSIIPASYDPIFQWPPADSPASEPMTEVPLSCLTGRELEVLRSLASGNRNKEIAEQLFLTIRTVRFHTENLYRKLGVRTRTQAVRIAIQQGLLTD